MDLQIAINKAKRVYRFEIWNCIDEIIKKIHSRRWHKIRNVHTTYQMWNVLQCCRDESEFRSAFAEISDYVHDELDNKLFDSKHFVKIHFRLIKQQDGTFITPCSITTTYPTEPNNTGISDSDDLTI